MTPADIDPAFVAWNLREAALWSAIGVGFAVAAFVKPKRLRLDCAIAAIAFIAFGASDVVETHTGAWWRPWWLLAWKAACVAGLLALLARHYRRRRAA